MRCSSCDQDHPIDTIELSFRRPDAIAEMDAVVREQSVREDDDLCAIGSTRFFVRTVLPLKVFEPESTYRIGIWAEIEKSIFRAILDLWSAPNQEDLAPFDAWIANSISILPNVLGLPTKLRLTGPDTRPELWLEQNSHPLAIEQALGISEHRKYEYSLLAVSGAA